VFEQQGENNSSLSCRHTLPPTAILLKGRKNTLLQGRCMLSEPNTYQVLLAPHHPAGLSSGTVLIPSRSAKLLSAAGRIGQVLGSGMHRTTMQAVPSAPPLCFLHVMQKPLPSSPTSTNHPAGLSSGTVLIPSRSAKLLVAPQVRPQALSAYSLRIRQTALVWRAQLRTQVSDRVANPMRKCAHCLSPATLLSNQLATHQHRHLWVCCSTQHHLSRSQLPAPSNPTSLCLQSPNRGLWLSWSSPPHSPQTVTARLSLVRWASV
jgi:hypothetical protein